MELWFNLASTAYCRYVPSTFLCKINWKSKNWCSIFLWYLNGRDNKTRSGKGQLAHCIHHIDESRSQRSRLWSGPRSSLEPPAAPQSHVLHSSQTKEQAMGFSVSILVFSARKFRSDTVGGENGLSFSLPPTGLSHPPLSYLRPRSMGGDWGECRSKVESTYLQCIASFSRAAAERVRHISPLPTMVSTMSCVVLYIVFWAQYFFPDRK